MRQALAAAQQAASREEVPVGAVVVYAGEVIGEGHNRREACQSALGHAELVAIEQASGHLSSWRLSECDIYVTLEPCIMCMGAIIQARIDRLVFGAHDPKAGAVESCYHIGSDALLNHSITIESGILAEECGAILKDFFRGKRRR